MGNPGKALEIVDRIAIEDLLSDFSSRVDEGRAATVHELFEETGELKTPAFTCAGREAIRQRFTARAADASRRSRHYWSNPRFAAFEGDAIAVVTNVMTVIQVEGRPTLITGGTSHDVVVPLDGGWAFRSRRLDVLFEGTLGAAEARP